MITELLETLMLEPKDILYINLICFKAKFEV